MDKFKNIIFWILSDALLIFGITFFPSLFSVFCLILGILFIPIEEWQKILKKVFKKSIFAIIIAVCIAFIIAEFPIARFVTGINNIINPPPVSSNFKMYYEEPAKATSTSQITSSSNATTSTQPFSSKESSKNQSSYSPKASTSHKQFSSNKSSTYNNAASSKNYVSSHYITENNYENHQNNRSTTSKFSSNPTPNNNETINTGVYRTPTGKRYHFSPTCGGKNSFEISFEDAINDGLTPCKKCVE